MGKQHRHHSPRLQVGTTKGAEENAANVANINHSEYCTNNDVGNSLGS